MGIGTSIFLLATGAVLAFGVRDSLDGADLSMIGYILMGAGALGLLLFLTVFGRKKQSTVTTTESSDGRGNRVVQSEAEGNGPPSVTP